MLTDFFQKILSSFITFFIFGILLGNQIFLYMSIVFLFFIIISLILDQPKTIVFNRSEQKIEGWVGETVEISIDVEIRDGLGIVTLADVLPDHFELVEGSNFKIVWKGLGEKKERLSYKVRCSKRGVYTLNQLFWESRHLFKMKQTLYGRCTQSQTLIVRPKILSIRKARNFKTVSKLPIPLESLSRTGIRTTDFREIREYSYGDPFKSINWKATARLSNKGVFTPFVNEFEKEGKKSVWIFVDGSHRMWSHGTPISNAFEYAINAANALAHYYLERGCLVGLYLYSSKNLFLHPEVGRKQYYKISKALLRVGIGDEEPLKKAIEKCRHYIFGTNPLSIVITTLTRSSASEIVEGVKELSKYCKKARRPSILIINILDYHFAVRKPQEELAARMLQIRDYSIKKALRRSGVVVIDWNPLKESLMNVLIREVRRR